MSQPPDKPFQKILVANRGEIAMRIIRTCRDLNLQTVAVFSAPDRTAPYVRLADEAYPIGPAPAGESYLNQDKIIRVANQSGADAVHPGYGFLSENPDFARACHSAGLTFIGPPATAIERMGNKTTARQMMIRAGVPVVPGTQEAITDSDTAAATAKEIGFPVLVKAAAGGGGKGMRIVEKDSQLPGAIEAAQREADAAFGDKRVFIEKYIQEPRHIEFQVLADHHGNTIHLFERECSVQRRHQKVIEEAPSSLLSSALRKEMGAVAVKAAQEAGYVNAGTVEFILDKDNNYYFLEMNTRLQVEHPVTEWITGTDLVAQQIHVAEGKPLELTQETVAIRGHAIESRVYAEDPTTGFLPDSGLLKRHSPPLGPGIRVDTGVEQGMEISLHYDPMIAKVISWGNTRSMAQQRMKRALKEYEVAGVATTIAFCQYVMDHPSFSKGQFSTAFVEKHFSPEALEQPTIQEKQAAAAAAALFRRQSRVTQEGASSQSGKAGRSQWWQRRR